MMQRAIAGTVAAALVFLIGGVVAAKDLTYGAFIRTNHPAMTKAIVPYLETVSAQSGGEMKWTAVASGQLVNIRTTFSGLRDGIVDGGFLIPVYTRKQLAHSMIPFDMQLFSQDQLAVTGASNETLLLGCPQCAAELKKQKIVFVGAYGTSPFQFMCNREIGSFSELKNKKIRGSGSSGRLIKAIGSTPVNMPPSDGVQAMQRKALDCAAVPVVWLRAYGYQDVVKHVIDTPLGSAYGSLMSMHRGTWDRLSLASKKLMVEHLPLAISRSVLIAYRGLDESVRKGAMAAGIKFSTLGKEMDDAIAAHLVTEEQEVASTAQKLGVKNPAPIMETYKRNLKKWSGLTKGLSDVDKFAQLLKTEIFDKVDISKH